MSHNHKQSLPQQKKRKHRDSEQPNIKSPSKKRQKVTKRSSKKPLTIHNSTPNSHITITFANINDTIDAITLPKQNVLAIPSDILLPNRGKLSIKKSELIQTEIAPEIPIEIQKLVTPISSIKPIHSRNSFRMGCTLFYCSDEQALFWAFPLRNCRRVSCQHFCISANRIVTRSVGIYSNKCNGTHSKTKSCVYAVCNGKPPKGTMQPRFYANYQYFQHSANTRLLIPAPVTRGYFKMNSFSKVPNTMGNCGGPPPLVPMDDSKKVLQSKMGSKFKTDMDIDMRQYKGESIPFQQNVQINLKALKQNLKLKGSASTMTSASSIDTEPEAHDYTHLCWNGSNSSEQELQAMETKVSNRKKCKELLINGRFTQVIGILKPLLGNANDGKIKSNEKLNECRLLMATALYYSNESARALQFCELVLNDANNSVHCYEARKIRGLINKDLHNFKAACHDLEFVAYNNPYMQTWRDRLYAHKPKTKPFVIHKNMNINLEIPLPIPDFSADVKPRLNEIITTPMQPSINVWQNNYNNYYPQTSVNNYAIPKPELSNPNGPIVFVPPIMDRNRNNERNNNYNLGQPKRFRFPTQNISSASLEGYAPLQRKTTREELLGESDTAMNSSVDANASQSVTDTLSTNMATLDRAVSSTPEPLQRIRSDALMN